MTSAAVRIGVGTRLVHDGELVEIVEARSGQTGMDVVLKGISTQTFIRARLNELLMSDSMRVIPDSEGPCSDDDFEPAGVVLTQLSDGERTEVTDIRPRADGRLQIVTDRGEVEDRDFVGLWATSVQHQIDHLNGRLYVDHLSPLRRKMLVARSAKLRRG